MFCLLRCRKKCVYLFMSLISKRYGSGNPLIFVYACMWFSCCHHQQYPGQTHFYLHESLWLCIVGDIGVPSVTVSKSSKTFLKRKASTSPSKMRAPSPPLAERTGVGRGWTEQATQLLKHLFCLFRNNC